jgi:hypothetical protein
MYVKVKSIYGRKAHKTKKTRICKGAADMGFNESFSFNIGSKQLDALHFTVSLMTSRGALTSDEVYGKVTLGPFMYGHGAELIHWQDMLAQPRAAVTRWHCLTPPVITGE